MKFMLMTDSAITILLVMLELLANAHAPRNIVQENLCDLAEIATAIDVYDERHSAEWFLTIAFAESKFNYRNPDQVITARECSGEDCNRVACGIYQQLPVYASGPPVSCQELRNPWTATSYMAAKLDVFVDRWGPLDDSVCHYCGQVCRPIPKGEEAPAHGNCYAYGQRTVQQAEAMRHRLDRVRRNTHPMQLENWAINLPVMCQNSWVSSQRELSMFGSIRSIFGLKRIV